MTDDKPPQNEVMAPGEMLPYPTPRQLTDFQQKRKLGVESFFRTRLCDSCGKEAPNVYECCSEECYNKLHPKEET